MALARGIQWDTQEEKFLEDQHSLVGVEAGSGIEPLYADLQSIVVIIPDRSRNGYSCLFSEF